MEFVPDIQRKNSQRANHCMKTMFIAGIAAHFFTSLSLMAISVSAVIQTSESRQNQQDKDTTRK